MDNPTIPNPWILRPITTVYIPIFKAKKSTLRSQAEVEAEVVCSEYNLITCFCEGTFSLCPFETILRRKSFFETQTMGYILHVTYWWDWYYTLLRAVNEYEKRVSLPKIKSRFLKKEISLPTKKIRKKEKKDWKEKYSSGNINTLNIIIILVLNWHAFEIQISNEMEWYEIN